MSDRYLVWAFRRHHGCYDCGAEDSITAAPNAQAVELDHADFSAFLLAARLQHQRSDYVYLYRKVDDNALSENIAELVKLGRVELEREKEREQKRKDKATEKAAKTRVSAEKKQLEELKKQKKLYEELKAKFEE